MREVIAFTNFCNDDGTRESFEGYLVQFINSGLSILGIVELVNGSIRAFPIELIKYKYPTAKKK
jgi:hypothetical protein